MAKLEIKIPIHTNDREGKDAEYIKSKLSGLNLDWMFYGKKSTFSGPKALLSNKTRFQ